MKAKKFIAILAATGLALTGCSTKTNQPAKESSTQAAHNHDDHAHEKIAYHATYDLNAATYVFEGGHTHEKYVHLAWVKTDDGTADLEDIGSDAMKTEEVDVEKGKDVTVKSGSVYHVELEHMKTEVKFAVPEQGKWTLFADIAPGAALPWVLKDASGKELKPVASKVNDNSANDIYKGYFEDSQVKDRPLSDYEGKWQSVYPFLLDGSLDKVMAHKAEDGSMTKEQWTDYYKVGYKTDIQNIEISGDQMSFTTNGKTVKGTYAYERYEILKYKKGNRGVRFLFTKKSGDEGAPKYVQFSDHNIYPVKASHFHIYMGNESQAKLLEEMDNWPTYYPSSMSKEQVVEEMMAH